MENTVVLDDVVLNPLANANGKRNAEDHPAEVNSLESAPKKPRVRKANSQRWNEKEVSLGFRILSFIYYTFIYYNLYKLLLL